MRCTRTAIPLRSIIASKLGRHIAQRCVKATGCEGNGQFVENLVEPAVLRLFQERGIDVREVSRSMRSQRPGAAMEAAYNIYGAVAGIEIDEGVDRFAYQRGLFVIKQTGDTVMIANNSTFQPTAW